MKSTYNNTVTEKIQKTAEAYIDDIILASDPLYPVWNRESIIFAKQPKWNYIDNSIIKALTMLYELTGDNRLIDYSVKFIDSYVSEDGEIPTMNVKDYNLDNVNGGKNLIYLYRKTGNEKYRTAFEKVYSQLETQPRLTCGNFWHKIIYPNQVWLDGVYMAMPFMAEYADLVGNSKIHEDILRQTGNIMYLMRDNKTGLYFHGYDETHSMHWADPSTGLSGEFWLRSMGWLSAGLVDICDAVGSSNPLYGFCGRMLSNLLESLAVYADSDGTFYQLPAKAYLERNYTETSGTLLFAYSAMKSARLGITGGNIRQCGFRAFSSVTEKYVHFSDGIPILENICLVAGLGGSQKRDGSEKYYLNEKITQNDAKGIAPYLMAYCEYKWLIHG